MVVLLTGASLAQNRQLKNNENLSHIVKSKRTNLI